MTPLFVRDNEGKFRGVDLTFNGWGQWPIRTGHCNCAKDPMKTENGVMDQPIGGELTVAAFTGIQNGVDGPSSGGGTIHCATQQQPA